MRVLVTGATGFVGFHTVLSLVRSGHHVRLSVRNEEKMRKLYAGTDVDISDYVVSEITDAVAIDSALEGCDAVVHTAAVVGLEPELEEMMMLTNMKGTELVIAGAVQKGIQSIVYVSSLAAMFDPQASTINESSPLTVPLTAYAASKKQCDEYVRELIEQGANIAISYPAAVLGPNDPALSEMNQGLAFLYKYCHLNLPTGIQIIDVRELADAQVKLLEGEKSGKYIIAGHYSPWKDYGLLLEKVACRRMWKLPMPGWGFLGIGIFLDFCRKFIAIGMPLSKDAAIFGAYWVAADDSKIRKELDLTYRPLEETVRDTLLWMAENEHVDKKWVKNIKTSE